MTERRTAEALARYEEMRDFSRTPEPAPPPTPSDRSGPLTFTIQKHAARRLHYDLRLEIDGVLVSWPIPQGPSYDPAVRRLAIHTEDHPYDYGTFEGLIPAGEYGGGQVIVWDAGTYTVLEADEPPDFSNRARAEGLARAQHKKGHLRVFLNGRKLKGGWTLTKTKGGEATAPKSEWLFIKRRDGLENPTRNVVLEDASVFSGLTIEDLKVGKRPRNNGRVALRPTAAAMKGAKKASYPAPYEPMLPTLTEHVFQRSEWLYEPKLDGYRVLAFVNNGTVHLRSRGGQAYEQRYPEVVRALAAQPVATAVFDGEVVAIGPDGRFSFQRLQSSGADPNAVLRFYAFDLLYLDGYDVRDVPLSERKALLHAVLAPVPGIEEVASFDDGIALYGAAEANQLEGIVAKKRDSLYEPGKRVRTWLKIKTHLSDEFVVAGFTTGTGRRSESIGSLILGRYDSDGKLRYAGHVGTGFDERSLNDMLRRLQPLRRKTSPFDEPVPKGGAASRSGGTGVWVEPKTVVEIKFAERTGDGRLRHPVFQRVREDKPVVEARSQALAAAPPDQIGTALAALEAAGESATLHLDGHQLKVTNLKKLMWPAWGERRALTKRDLVRYYLQIAPYVLPHLQDRPVTMTRFPDGIHGQRFYQKSPKEGTPPFVERFWSFSEHNNANDEYFVCNNVATLLWLAQLADLELHVTHTRITAAPDAPQLSTRFTGSLSEVEESTLNFPDYLVTDLDPYLYSGKEAADAEPELHPEGFSRARDAAYWYREILEGIGLHPFLKTTGKTGLHLYVPIERTLDYDGVRAVAETLAKQVRQLHPKAVTVDWAVVARRGKVFLDYNMNRRSASLAAPYSPRAIDWAGVSTPIGWGELDSVYPTQFDILNVPERLARMGDPWAGILEQRVDLNELLGR